MNPEVESNIRSPESSDSVNGIPFEWEGPGDLGNFERIRDEILLR